MARLLFFDSCNFPKKIDFSGPLGKMCDIVKGLLHGERSTNFYNLEDN